MVTFVLTRPENAKSAIKLGYPVVTEDCEIPSGANVIRWGNGLSADKRGWGTVLNKSATLQLSTDKLAALQALSRVVKTPEIYLHGTTLPRGHRYVARPASHAEGSDFHLINGGSPLTHHHATRFIEDTREYRVWFVRDKYLCAKRIPRSSEGQEASDPCRSKWGYGEYVECFAKLKEEVAKARQAIPLDFGAMDVLWKDGDPGAWYFLEVNSAPSLDTPTLVRHFSINIKTLLPTVQDALRTRTNAPGSTQGDPEVSEVVRPTLRRSNGIVERPSITPSFSDTYEARQRAKLQAEKKAIDERIYREVFGD